MRPVPKGKLLQRNLDTHYVRVEGVISSLHEEAFTGYVRAVLDRDEGLVFFRDGDLVACVLEREGRVAKGLDALVALLAAVRADRAFLDICRLDHDLLAALLASWHGVTNVLEGADAPGSPAAALALAASRRLTGALSADAAGAECVCYVADGEPLGWHLTATDAWVPKAGPAPAGLAGGWRFAHAPAADALRTIDLGSLKERVMGEMIAATGRFVPSFGPRLFAVERARRNAADPRSLDRAGFLALAEGAAGRARLLVGEARARELHADLAARAAAIVDLGY
ncbi:MAG: hypothetical protein AAB368_04610 [bacterium]